MAGIDWSKRVSSDDKYIDMRGLPYYNISFNDGNKEVIYGMEVNIPDEPEDHECVNWGLDEYNQIFRKTLVPDQVRHRDRDFGRLNWSQREVDSFIDHQWNLRKNGLWIWIKNRKTYIPGQLWFKYNAWTPSTGEEFEYRNHEREFFTFMLHIQRDPIDLGVADFKCRQLGDTENALVIMYERGSRKRGSLTTMQSCINEEHIIGAYERLIHAHKNMVYWFKPMNTGTENPKKGLVLDYPTKYLTHAEISRQNESGNIINKSSAENYEYPPIGSKFQYGPSKVKHFDGRTGVLTAYDDEFGKSSDMDPVEWIQTMVETVFSNIRGKKRGIIIMTSTVEDMTENSLEWAMQIYKESDPNKRKTTGSTVNRIVRIFRGVADRGFETIVADRWGDIDREAVIAAVTEQYNAYMEAGNSKGAMSFLRKNPRTIDDVFLSARNASSFNTQGLAKREFYLTEVAKPKPYVRGNLKWKDGERDTEVVWEPNESGRWLISKHPSDFGLFPNSRSARTFAKAPGNRYSFSMGVDPVDQSKTLESDEKRSKIGICVMRRLDESIDSDKGLWHQEPNDLLGINVGDPVMQGELHTTGRVCCTYLDRQKDVFDNFEDIILTAHYYGTEFLPENNKAGALKTYLRNREYELYLTDKPSLSKNYKGQQEKDGVTGSEKTFNECFSFIETYTYKWVNAIDHPDLTSQLMTMNWGNRGEKDLGVAFGWCLYHAQQQVPQKKREDRDEGEIVHFHEHYV